MEKTLSEYIHELLLERNITVDNPFELAENIVTELDIERKD